MQSQRREKGKNEGRTKEKREGSSSPWKWVKGQRRRRAILIATRKHDANNTCGPSCVSESGRIYAQLLRFGGVFSSPPSSARKLAVRHRRDFRFTGGHRDPFMPAHADHSLYAPVGQVQAFRDYVFL